MGKVGEILAETGRTEESVMQRRGKGPLQVEGTVHTWKGPGVGMSLAGPGAQRSLVWLECDLRAQRGDVRAGAGPERV